MQLVVFRNGLVVSNGLAIGCIQKGLGCILMHLQLVVFRQGVVVFRKNIPKNLAINYQRSLLV